MTITNTLKLSLVTTMVMVTANAASAIDGDDLPLLNLVNVLQRHFTS